MAFICSGCSSSFRTEHALATHRPHCKKIVSNLGSLLKRKREAAALQVERQARQRLEAVAAEEPMEVDEEVAPVPAQEEPVAGPSTVAQAKQAYVEAQATGRHPRVHRAPRRVLDFLPSSLTSLRGLPQYFVPPSPEPAPPSPTDDPDVGIPDNRHSPTPPPALEYIVSPKTNDFGLFRSYLRVPTQDPEAALSLEDTCDAPTFAVAKPRAPWWSVFGRSAKAVRTAADNPFAPFLNATVFNLMSWFYSGSSMKSLTELDRLVNDVLLAEDFKQSDLHAFSAVRESQRLDEWIDEDSQQSQFPVEDGWRKGTVRFPVPCEGEAHVSEEATPHFEIPNVPFRRFMDIIKATFSSERARTFHLSPFKLWVRHPDQPPGTPPERAYSELFNSDAMNKEYEKIITRFSPLRPTLEIVIAAIMLWSDSTHLAQFGTASLWPIYAFFGNQSKYVRCKPTEFAAHHLAYIPSLPDTFQDWYKSVYDRAASASVLTHCKRELMHAVWQLLLDDEFMEAYEHGVVIMFADGIARRVFPRIFTYSADYPEKILLATIRFLGTCPCPRCLIQKSQISEMGTKLDARRRTQKARVDDNSWRSRIERVRGWIYEQGDRIAGTWVERLLFPGSWVPTRNTFSERLSKFGFDFHHMLAVDLLHEYELGTWKATFTHLIRVLFAAGGDKIQELNKRYRSVPTFGRSTIRRFVVNTSAMKKLAARDWEDMLQCAIPVFEGLLEEPYNTIVMDLLFTMAMWHGLAKLRMHTTSTLSVFEQVTAELGSSLRRFSSGVCSHFRTRELPREEAARGRRTAAKVSHGAVQGSARGRRGKGKGRATQPTATPDEPQASSSSRSEPPTTIGPPEPSATPAARSKGPRIKHFNMSTYKLHALGDYPGVIPWFGTTDNYSTQTGELEHRRVKRFYARTNRNNFTQQITKQHMREEVLRRIRSRHAMAKKRSVSRPHSASPEHESEFTTHTPQPQSNDQASHLHGTPVSLSFADDDPLPYTAPDKRYHVSETNRHFEDLAEWLSVNENDPAFKEFEAGLKDHVLRRLDAANAIDSDSQSDEEEEHEYTNADKANIVIVNDRIYRHKVIRMNYTTYDLRRAQDSLNPRTHADIMVRSQEDQTQRKAHPYWYARIVGIFHLYVQDFRPGAKTQRSQRLDVLWVRWFGRDMKAPGGFRARRLYRIGFVNDDDFEPLGFVAPEEVIRGVHLIPAFHYGTTEEYMGPSIVRPPSDNDEDWVYYYVNIFVDRDMIMRFLGGGIGHRLASYTMDDTELPEPAGDEAAGADGDGDPDETPGDVHIETEAVVEERNALGPDVGDDDPVQPTEEEGLADGEEDYGYEHHSEDEEDEEDEDNRDVDEDDLGPEDGEDAGIEDWEGDEGYAQL